MRLTRLLGAFLLCFSCFYGVQTATAMTLAQVVKQVLEHHPDIALSRLDPELAATEVLSVRGQLDPQVTAQLGLSDESTPLVSQFAPIGTTKAGVQGSITKPLAGGPSIGLDFDYSRSLLSFSSPFAAQLANPNPAYSSQVNINYRHPLLKGAGRPGYNQALAAAQASEQEAGIRQYAIDEQLALKAVQLYFTLAADSANLKLAAESVGRAQRLLEYQHTQESFGLIETADRLQAEALVAARKMERRKAEALVAQNQTALNRLMLREADAPIAVELEAMPTQTSTTLERALASARLRRPQLVSLDASLQAAEARLAEAQDRQRVQLDVVAELGTRAVAASAGTAARQGLSINDRFAFIGMEFSDTLPNRAAKGAIRKAELQRQQVLLERQQAIERLKDELAGPLTAMRMRHLTFAAAKQRAAAEKRKFEAEIRRYREGRSDTATVVQFETDLRTAEVQVTLEEFLLRLAYNEFAWAEGTLLDAFGLAWPSFSSAQP